MSEAIDILTRNPEVWKKTIFILCYDENDGYYDHIPPFSIPDPFKNDTGKVSDGIDIKAEYVTLEQDLGQVSKASARAGAIGLGFRTPLVVASPWSRGGKVCSQVFDHTSIIQFLEEFTSHKAKKAIRETNITAWRRTICGNLSSVFQPYDPSTYVKPKPVDRDEIVTTIHKAKFKDAPANFRALDQAQIDLINKNPRTSGLIPVQEQGTRRSCSIPYELYVDGRLSADGAGFEITMKAGNGVFGKRSSGSPFVVYALNPYRGEVLAVRNYAVRAGDMISDRWELKDFQDGKYHLRVYGPNGFFREFGGESHRQTIRLSCEYVLDKRGKPSGDLMVVAENTGKAEETITIIDNAYKQKPVVIKVEAGKIKKASIVLRGSFGWYDLDLQTGRPDVLWRCAGRVETGQESMTDPLMA